MTKGIIYVLTNPAMPDLVKIGKTMNIDQRLSSLYSTGVPLPFKCIYAKKVEDMDFVETKLHAAFDSKRLNQRREFFKILEEELIHFFDLIPGEEVTPQEEKFDTDLFDNMNISNLKKGVKLAKKYYETEASGNINIKNVKSVAATGVDRISIGAITHSVKAIDLKLEFN